ncbi:MAG: porphobilinogen synthase [Candidatus Bathyarchaeota archaeon]|nr:porphobilinogen synthase [Candidatus Bathyarchaeum tardum]
MAFPSIRMRRLRRTPALRALTTTVRIHPSNLIQPLFIDENAKSSVPLSCMSGCCRLPLDHVIDEARQILENGVNSVLLFGVPKTRDEKGSEAFNKSGIVQKAVHNLKTEFGDELVVMTDVCLCEYTNHGHCGIVKNNQILNDSTLELLQKMAVSHSEAGADIVAPSSMMDGQVMFIRQALDDSGFGNVGIMAYSAKYASSFYGPFREAVDSAPSFGNRKCYQMSYAKGSDEALREMELDANEGADILMVKPAMAYLDIISMAKSNFSLPIAAYSVSGEYAMIKTASQNGWIDEKAAGLEMLTGIKRAGADIIITYFAKDVESWLNQQ